MWYIESLCIEADKRMVILNSFSRTVIWRPPKILYKAYVGGITELYSNVSCKSLILKEGTLEHLLVSRRGSLHRRVFCEALPSHCHAILTVDYRHREPEGSDPQRQGSNCSLVSFSKASQESLVNLPVFRRDAGKVQSEVGYYLWRSITINIVRSFHGNHCIAL